MLQEFDMQYITFSHCMQVATINFLRDNGQNSKSGGGVSILPKGEKILKINEKSRFL